MTRVMDLSQGRINRQSHRMPNLTLKLSPHSCAMRERCAADMYTHLEKVVPALFRLIPKAADTSDGVLNQNLLNERGIRHHAAHQAPRELRGATRRKSAEPTQRPRAITTRQIPSMYMVAPLQKPSTTTGSKPPSKASGLECTMQDEPLFRSLGELHDVGSKPNTSPNAWAMRLY